jgi:hypothetical protein
MFNAIKEFFFGKPQAAPEAPYKVETPVPVEVVAPAPVEAVRKPRANVAARKIAAVKKPAAKKPAAPKAE